MSIYPVRLSEWFLPNDEMFATAVAIGTGRCRACFKRVRWKAAIGHHSLPWGYGDLWCSWKCCRSGKVAKPDKRQLRARRRKSVGFVGPLTCDNSGESNKE